MTSNEIKALTGQYVMNTYGRFPVAIERGEGARLYDFEGNEYIDFTSGIGVTDLGYGDQCWVDAITAQAKKLGHVSNLFYTEPAARLAEKDKRRKVNYQHYTGRNWGDAQNFDVCLDSSKLGVEACADIIVDIINRCK